MWTRCETGEQRLKNLPFASPDGDFLLADTHLYIDSPSSSLVVERASVHGARRCAERCVMDMNLYCLQVGAGDSYMGAFLVSLREKGALEKGVLAKMVRPNPAPSCRCILCDVGESIFVPAGGRVAGGDDGVRGEGGSGDVHKGGRRPADPRRGVLNGPLLLPLLRTTRLVTANAATLASPGKCFGEALT